MKTYQYKNEIIHEDELKEITLPKVGDRLRFIVDALTNPNQKVGEGVTVEGLHPIEIKDKNGMFGIISLQEYCTCFEPIPSPPVCPPELLPLPDGAVYCGVMCGHYPKYRFLNGVWSGSEWGGIVSDAHYATVAGDACHRAQPWFSEDQVPEVDLAEQAWLKYDGTANHRELFKAGFNAARKNDI